MYYRTRAAPRFRTVRGGTSWVRKSYAYDPVRCKTSRRGQGKCISIVVRILFRPLLGPCLGSCLEHVTLAENEIAEDNLAFSPQGLKSLALDRVLDIHKLFTAGTNKRK